MNNIIVNAWYSKVALGHRNGLKIRVFGSEGSAEWYQMNPEILKLVDEKGSIQLLDRSSINIIESNKISYQRFKPGHPAGFVEAYANLYRDIYWKLKSKEKYDIKIRSVNFPYISGVINSLEYMKLLEAIELSSVTNKWVEVT